MARGRHLPPYFQLISLLLLLQLQQTSVAAYQQLRIAVGAVNYAPAENASANWFRNLREDKLKAVVVSGVSENTTDLSVPHDFSRTSATKNASEDKPGIPRIQASSSTANEQHNGSFIYLGTYYIKYKLVMFLFVKFSLKGVIVVQFYIIQESQSLDISIYSFFLVGIGCT